MRATTFASTLIAWAFRIVNCTMEHTARNLKLVLANLGSFSPCTSISCGITCLVLFSFVAYGQSGVQYGRVDVDGDDKTDIGVYRSGWWYVLLSSSGYSQEFARSFGGAANDIPVLGDLDGDGKTDIGVYRSGWWYVLLSSSGYSQEFAKSFGGAANDIPVLGDLDGDDKTDIGVYRSGWWYVLLSSSAYNREFARSYGGMVNDVPLAPGAPKPPADICGGDNSFATNFDFYWWEFPYGCRDETYQGNLWLSDASFQLFGPNINMALPLQNVTGVAYDDGSVKVENLRKTDNDRISVTKFIDHIHWRVDLKACTSDGGAHRYIRITVRGKKN